MAEVHYWIDPLERTLRDLQEDCIGIEDAWEITAGTTPTALEMLKVAELRLIREALESLAKEHGYCPIDNSDL
jgi:hypothetical protein